MTLIIVGIQIIAAGVGGRRFKVGHIIRLRFSGHY